jgi:hypothetical protein
LENKPWLGTSTEIWNSPLLIPGSTTIYVHDNRFKKKYIYFNIFLCRLNPADLKTSLRRLSERGASSDEIKEFMSKVKEFEVCFIN